METDFSTEPIPAKAAEAEKARVHTMITIGGRDMKAGAVSVRLHDDGQQGAKPKAEVVTGILASIRERKALEPGREVLITAHSRFTFYLLT